MKCFYHKSDLDGKCSAALVKLAYPDCELIGIDYGDEFPKGSIQMGEDVWMVDFCLQPFTEMWWLKDLVNSFGGEFVWIDHHKTAIDAALSSGFYANRGRLEVGKAACELIWEFLHPGETIPEAVWLLGRYDVWDLEANPRVVPFQYGMMYEDIPVDDQEGWRTVVEDRGYHITRIVQTGRIIQRSIEQGFRGTAEYACFEIEWEGMNWIAINGPYRGSGVFKSVFDPRRHHGMLSFFWNGKEWRFGMYSDREDVDVSAVAKKYGGGGHKGAAGFQRSGKEFMDDGMMLLLGVKAWVSSSF